MSIPKQTTLKQRLEFYEYALDEIKSLNCDFLCFCINSYYGLWKNGSNASITDIENLFPEVYSHRIETDHDNLLWDFNNQRIEALQKAIVDVKRKMKLS